MKTKEIENDQFSFPPIWLKLCSDLNKESEELSLFLAKNSIPCDLSVQPSVWGHLLSKWNGLCLIKGNFDYENAKNGQHVHDLITAYLVQILCSIKRPRLDFFILPIRKKISQHTLQGIKETIQQAKEEKLIKFFGVYMLDCSREILEMNILYDFIDTIVVSENNMQGFEDSHFNHVSHILYETSSLISRIKPNSGQILSIKSLNEIYNIRSHLDVERESF